MPGSNLPRRTEMPALKRTELPTEYKVLYGRAKEMGETNDCTVKAIALVTGIDYQTVQMTLELCGRKNRHGASEDIQAHCLKLLGFTWTRWSYAKHREMIASYPKAHRRLQSITTHHPRRFAAQWAQ